jgi:acyl-coenzyme A thioesterase PaaI-like protein
MTGGLAHAPDRPREPARFAADTAVEPIDPTTFAATVTERWAVLGGGAPNGGYLMAIAARAMSRATARPDPITLTAHFVRPATPGPATVAVEVIKAGRRHATVQAALLQDGDEKVRLLGAFGDLSQAAGPTRLDRPPPDLPPIDACVDVVADAAGAQHPAPPILQRFDHRMVPGAMDWTRGNPIGRGEIGGWCRWAGDEPMDTLGLLVVADAYPPAVFNAGGPIGWVPTVELTVQIRKRPPPGWLRVRMSTDLVTSGYLEEDGEIWDEAGEPVALSRQLALVAQPRG